MQQKNAIIVYKFSEKQLISSMLHFLAGSKVYLEGIWGVCHVVRHEAVTYAVMDFGYSHFPFFPLFWVEVTLSGYQEPDAV